LALACALVFDLYHFMYLYLSPTKAILSCRTYAAVRAGLSTPTTTATAAATTTTITTPLHPHSLLFACSPAHTACTVRLQDGLTWSNLTIGAFGPNQNLANGSVWENAYIERPQVVQDKQGNPIALFLGMSKLDGYADSVSWSSKFCAPGQVCHAPRQPFASFAPLARFVTLHVNPLLSALQPFSEFLPFCFSLLFCRVFCLFAFDRQIRVHSLNCFAVRNDVHW
jgi:hypothetical protein